MSSDSAPFAEGNYDPFEALEAADKFSTADILDIEADESEPPEEVWGGLRLAPGQLMEVIGGSGLGKSRMMVNLAINQVLGRDFAGLPTCKRPLKWVFFGNENGYYRYRTDARMMLKFCNSAQREQIRNHIFLPTLKRPMDAHVSLSDEKNRIKFKKVFQPILNYAKDLGVTLCVENCPMEGWLPVTAPDAYNNLPGCLAARKLMYAILDDDSKLQETYDPSHDIWQHIDPSDVICAMDFKKLRRVHIKGTRNFTNDAEAVHWGRLYPQQSVSAELARKAGVPLPGSEWDRLSYEPRLPGFGGSDSCDWTKFLETLMAKGYRYPFVIENEGCNSSHTGNMGATMQGFRATVLNTAPVVWPLGPNGYEFDASALKPMTDAMARDLPVKTMADLV